MLDINGIINFGKRLSDKKEKLNSEEWDTFVNRYFCGNFKGVNKFIYLGNNPLRVISEFYRNPQLSLNGLYRAVKKKNTN